MIPQLFSLGPIDINTFGLSLALALLVSVKSVEKSFVVFKINPSIAERYVLVAGVVGVIFARIWYILEDWSFYSENLYSQDLYDAIFSGSGFTFYGGFIFAALAIFILRARSGIPLGDFVDSLGPTLAVAYGIGRLGCQLSGDGDYGIPTTYAYLGMSYETGVLPTPQGVKVFPTPLYETAVCFAIYFFLKRLELNESLKKTSGNLFAIYLLLISLERFFIEFLRPNNKLIYSLSQAQLIAIALLIFALLILIFNRFRARTS
jgi:phosphatidylglycerol---prolipoprotein diacylglyceryl transferase